MLSSMEALASSGAVVAPRARSAPLFSSPSSFSKHKASTLSISQQRTRGIIIKASSSSITFHVENSSITVPLSQEAAQGLSRAIEGLLETFKEKQQAERPRRWESMEFVHSEDGLFFELFCNPNAYSNAFQAKVLLTLSDDKIKISSEGQLSAIKADVDQFVKTLV